MAEGMQASSKRIICPSLDVKIKLERNTKRNRIAAASPSVVERGFAPCAPCCNLISMAWGSSFYTVIWMFNLKLVHMIEYVVRIEVRACSPVHVPYHMCRDAGQSTTPQRGI